MSGTSLGCLFFAVIEEKERGVQIKGEGGGVIVLMLIQQMDDINKDEILNKRQRFRGIYVVLAPSEKQKNNNEYKKNMHFNQNSIAKLTPSIEIDEDKQQRKDSNDCDWLEVRTDQFGQEHFVGIIGS